MSDSGEEKSGQGEGGTVFAGGCVIFLEREEFIDVLKREKEPLVICSFRGTFKNIYTYVTCYRGLLFAHRSKSPIPLEGCELINAEEIRFCGRRLR